MLYAIMHAHAAYHNTIRYDSKISMCNAKADG